MGTIQVKDTHVKRSSHMAALRWKQGNQRLIIGIIIITLVLAFVFLVLLYGTKGKNVHLVLNGQESLIHTKQEGLQHLLDEQAISVSEHDRMSMPLSSKIKNGDIIILDHVTPIQLIADGKVNTLYTTGKTVAEAIEDLNIRVDNEDRVSPQMERLLSPNATIQIVRVKKVIEQEKEQVGFQVVTQKDPKLLKGKQRIVQNGQAGVIVKKLEKHYEDGDLASVTLIDQTIETKVINKIVAIGTKNPVVILSATTPTVKEVSIKGVNFDAKEILTNVTLTAYSAGFESTGKNAGDDQFGITFSGTKVVEGRTIAVDPKVIPIGWWVYIEGLGFRRAEDKGSAVKGKKIDVYFESEEYANRFGLKRGYTVYIIGPVKPSAN